VISATTLTFISVLSAALLAVALLKIRSRLQKQIEEEAARFSYMSK